MARKFFVAHGVLLLVFSLVLVGCVPRVTPRTPQPQPESGFHTPDEARVAVIEAKPDAPQAVVAPAVASETVKPDTPFKIGADADGQRTTEYRLSRANVVVQTKPLSALAGGVITFDEPGLPAGSYVYTVTAVRKVPAGPLESVSDPFAVNKVANVPLDLVWSYTISQNETVTAYRVLEGSTVVASKPGTDAVNGTITFSITNLSTGPHTLTNSVQSNFSVATDLVAPSSELTVMSTVQTTPQTIAVTPNPVASGAPQTVTWTCTSGCAAQDWIGLFRKGVSEPELWWPGVYTNAEASGTYTFPGRLGLNGADGPLAPGDYEWRYCVNNGYTCTASAAVTVTTTDPVPTNSIVTDATAYTPGAPVKITWTAATPVATDWVGLFDVNQNTNFGKYETKGAPTGSTTMPAPTTAGWYYARYCLANGHCPFVSPAFEVKGTPPPDVDCAGVWSEWEVKEDWGACVNNQQTRTLSHTFTITTHPQGNGKACPVSPETKVENRVCTSKIDAPVAKSCRFVMQAVPPDTNPGWRAQWRQNGNNVGPVDTTAPYERTFNVSRGLFTYDVLWSTSSIPAMASPTTTLECK